MSVLDDARELLNRGPGHPEYPMDEPCPYCCFLPHQEECAWLSMPKIVAALECVYGLMMSEDGAEPIEDDVWAHCQRPADGPHWDGCLWVKLRDLVYRGSAP